MRSELLKTAVNSKMLRLHVRVWVTDEPTHWQSITPPCERGRFSSERMNPSSDSGICSQTSAVGSHQAASAEVNGLMEELNRRSMFNAAARGESWGRNTRWPTASGNTERERERLLRAAHTQLGHMFNVYLIYRYYLWLQILSFINYCCYCYDVSLYWFIIYLYKPAI